MSTIPTSTTFSIQHLSQQEHQGQSWPATDAFRFSGQQRNGRSSIDLTPERTIPVYPWKPERTGTGICHQNIDAGTVVQYWTSTPERKKIRVLTPETPERVRVTRN